MVKFSNSNLNSINCGNWSKYCDFTIFIILSGEIDRKKTGDKRTPQLWRDITSEILILDEFNKG